MGLLSFLQETIKTFSIVIYISTKEFIKFFIPNRLKYMDVTNKVVLITGAGSGLGANMAINFAKLKTKIVIWDLNTTGLEKTSLECQKFIPESSILAFKVDVTNRDEVMETAEKILNTFGHVDILINNAGIVTGKLVMEIDEKIVDKSMKVNATSHFWTVQAFLPKMMERRSGSIVSIASLAGLISVYKLSDYNASKFAAVGFQEALMNELNHMGYGDDIHCLTVCPYYINTGMFHGVVSKNPLLPFLDQEYVVRKIIEAIKLRTRFLILPRLGYIFIFFRSFLPVDAIMVIANYFGLNASMESFKGRGSY